MTLAERLILRGKREGELSGELRGELRGKLEGRLEVATRMIEEGSNLAFVKKVTQLPLETLKGLQEQYSVG